MSKQDWYFQSCVRALVRAADTDSIYHVGAAVFLNLKSLRCAQPYLRLDLAILFFQFFVCLFVCLFLVFQDNISLCSPSQDWNSLFRQADLKDTLHHLPALSGYSCRFMIIDKQMMDILI